MPRDPNALTKREQAFLERLRRSGETIYLDLHAGGATYRRSGGRSVSGAVVARLAGKGRLHALALDLEHEPMQWGLCPRRDV